MTYHRGVDRSGDGEVDLPVVRVAFDRPEVRNAFRPHTVDELSRILDHARMTSSVGTVLLTGNGPSPRDGGWAFCSGGDQRIRGRDGYRYVADNSAQTADSIDPARAGRLHILEVQRLIRMMPKVVVALVSGWAAGVAIRCMLLLICLSPAANMPGLCRPMRTWVPLMVGTGQRIWRVRWGRSVLGRFFLGPRVQRSGCLGLGCSQ